MKRILIAFVAVGSFACASGAPIDLSKLPPIVIAAPAAETLKPASPAAKPSATLAFHVVDDATGAPIPTAIATFEDDTKVQANDDGYISVVKELNTYEVKISAADYAPAKRDVVLTGNRQFEVSLTSTKPKPAAPPVAEAPVVTPKPAEPPPPVPPVPTPEPAGRVAQCGGADNTLAVSQGCLDAVAKSSANYALCNRLGDSEYCHRYVREVVRALVVTQGDPRWGLITKPAGSNVEGYGEDIIAYLPAPIPLDAKTWQWRGLDVIGGAGAPGAHFQGGVLNAAVACPQPEGWCNRTDNLWAPVPR